MRLILRKQYLATMSVVLISIIAWLLSYQHHIVTSYSDAKSHLDIARLVVDNQQTGLAQLGSVWLPLSQLLYLPLVWSNWAWHSGFAGSVISMASYVFASIGIFHIVREFTLKISVGIAAALVYVLNPNMLYLQSTPLTEPLFLALLVGSTLYFIRYIRSHQAKYLVLAAIFTALQIVTRYDGWFIAFIELCILIYTERKFQQQTWGQTCGIAIFFALPSGVAAGLWFLWNYLIFGSALYSFTGPYSAHAQQATIAAGSGLITKANLYISTKTYILDIVANTGLIIVLLSVIGWILFLIYDKRLSLKLKLIITGLLSSTVVFNIIALYAGFSILNLPALHWNPTHDVSGSYFNVRYGILALPLVAVGVGMLALRSRKFITPLIYLSIVIQGGFLIHQGLITIKDGTIGSSSFNNADIAVALKHHVATSDTVIMSSSTYNGVMFESGLDLKQFIHEGVNSTWKDAIANPDHYAKWVVTANGDFGDPVYASVVKQEKNAFLKYYKLVYAAKHANLYEQRTTSERYITASKSSLELNSAVFTARGINDYDLAFQSMDQINATFSHLKGAGVNTIRFWMYGDGIHDGFQPSVGDVNNEQLLKTDYIFKLAKDSGIRLIPTLGNNFSDYGGASQYLKWAGIDPANHDQFYTDGTVRTLYKNYINHILTHKNTLTGTSYVDDPTILAWDIINEPRTTDPNNLAPWVNDISSYVRNLDSNHLITVGIDKPVIDSSVRDICAIKNITVCSIHLYPQETNIASFDSPSSLQSAINVTKQIANKINKPIMVSELGASKTSQPFGNNPIVTLTNTVKLLNTEHYSGWIIWNYSEKSDNSFGFSPTGDYEYNLQTLKKIIEK
jgi:hypothetical protein